jgi:hypothetical protein
MRTDIDITFDFRTDSPAGKDPDAYSKTLRRYHKLLWSKRLPGGAYFELTSRGKYFYHRSEIGDFCLSSDAVIPTFKWAAQIKSMIPAAELDAFNAIGYTIGGMMVFPANQVNHKGTINQDRGCNHLIRDRFDLTVECIRRYYVGESSPLFETLERYAPFFHLFADFKGYTEFFLLQDLVTSDFSQVRISQPFDDFRGSPIPSSVREYGEYKRSAVEFIEARNRRILHS